MEVVPRMCVTLPSVNPCRQFSYSQRGLDVGQGSQSTQLQGGQIQGARLHDDLSWSTVVRSTNHVVVRHYKEVTILCPHVEPCGSYAEAFGILVCGIRDTDSTPERSEPLLWVNTGRTPSVPSSLQS